MQNFAEAKQRAQEKQKLQDTSLDKDFDLTGESDILEWSRSDSPVRMYLREMGQISLLNKDEEVQISRKIELGEDIMIDAFCSVPYLIDFILDYREPLINRERRVKELFKSFDDDDKSDDSDTKYDEVEEVADEDEEEEAKASEEGEKDEAGEEKKLKKNPRRKNDERTRKVMEKFRALERAKKEWLKTAQNFKEIENNELL